MDEYAVYEAPDLTYQYTDYESPAYLETDPYLADPGWYDPEYDAYYTDPSDISITDEVYYDDPYDYDYDYTELEPDDTWIPLPPPSSAPPVPVGSNQQQILIQQPSPFFPGAVELSQGYCALYPEECLTGRNGVLRLPGVNTSLAAIPGCTTGSNCTVVQGGQGKGLGFKDVDMSGMGLGVLLAFLLLMGLHIGWDSGKAGKGKGKSN
jgi:hypothetical protein